MSDWEKNVRKVVPYTPGEQPKVSGIIKLNTNENPYPPSPAAKAALEAFDSDEMRLYPAPDASEPVRLFCACICDDNCAYIIAGSICLHGCECL